MNYLRLICQILCAREETRDKVVFQEATNNDWDDNRMKRSSISALFGFEYVYGHMANAADQRAPVIMNVHRFDVKMLSAPFGSYLTALVSNGCNIKRF